MTRLSGSAGSTLLELVVAMAILPIGLLGAMGAFRAASQTIHHGTMASRALAMVDSRIEAKRSARWDQLLSDDLDHDGVPDVVLRDDGQGGDLVSGDGTYTGRWEQEQILLTWTVTPSGPQNLMQAGHVVIEALAQYGAGRQEVRALSVRANPTYVGP